MKITESANGLYLEMVSQGIKYGQYYPTRDKAKAIEMFAALIRKYQTKGDLAVMGGY